MDFLQLAEKRYSVRKYDSSKKVEKEKLDKMIEAARLAPTACNYQPFKLLVIQSEEGIEKLSKAMKYTSFGASLYFVICYDKNESWKNPRNQTEAGLIDCSIVLTHIMMEATELGLGSVWINNYNQDTLREEFNLPDNYVDSAILIVGYPAEDAVPAPGHTQFRDLNEMIFFEEY